MLTSFEMKLRDTMRSNPGLGLAHGTMKVVTRGNRSVTTLPLVLTIILKG